MVAPLSEYFGAVRSSDIQDYGCGYQTIDFLGDAALQYKFKTDWIITNPPFNRAEEFFYRARELEPHGIAFLTRTAFLEGKRRHEKLFSQFPPFKIMQFVERVPIYRGRLAPEGSTAASYCWIIWLKDHHGNTRFDWIPPCRKALEKPEDYSSIV